MRRFGSFSDEGIFRAWRLRLVLAAPVVIAAWLLALPAMAATSDVSLIYGISLGNLRIGEVRVNARFDDNGYAVTLAGSTRGVSQMFSNPSVSMSARGTIRDGRVYPAEFQITMTEGVDAADATMTLRDRAVADLTVVPGLVPWFDLVPLTMEHVRNVVDPMSALIAPVRRLEGLTAGEACNRTIPVFDGWSRFDIVLGSGETRTVVGNVGGYSGVVYACGAEYRPIAGHRSGETAVLYMAGNGRLSATLMPIVGHPILVPYELLLGTELGDVVVRVERITYAAVP